MKKRTIFISLITILLFYSCNRNADKQIIGKSIHSIYCMDTSVVLIRPLDNGDTFYRLRAIESPGSGKLEDGIWRIYFDKDYKQKAAELTIKDNKKDGQYTYWRRNGNKWYEGIEINGLSQGSYRSWYKNGQLEYQAEYLNDTTIGTSQEWYETGELMMETEYLIGKKNKQIFYNKNGYKSWEAYYNNKPLSTNKFLSIRIVFDSIGMFQSAYRYNSDTVWNEERQAYYIYAIPTNIDSLDKTEANTR